MLRRNVVRAEGFREVEENKVIKMGEAINIILRRLYARVGHWILDKQLHHICEEK